MTKQHLDQLLELANLYPSPHNAQPIRLRAESDTEFKLYFLKERGLQSADISFLFSFASMGVFMQHLLLSAQALGHSLTYQLDLPQEKDLRGDGLVEFARCQVEWNKTDPDQQLEKVLRFRQTSRKKYSQGVDTSTAKEAVEIASKAKMNLVQLNHAGAQHAIWLNQRAVFDDMFEEPTRQELDHWLRYDQKQKQSLRDGLAYDCMELNGPLIKFIVNHHKILRWPGISGILKQYYLRTMSDSSSLFYLRAPFISEQNAFEVGLTIMKIWQLISAHGYYLHPFGTIMSNHAAHHDFLKLAKISDESRKESYVVFIFRCGTSEPPVRSLRIPYTDHLLVK